MTEMTMTESDEERRRRLRGRNLAMLAVLMGLVALFYVITLVRMGGN
ncbi:hypothetical protein [Azospirillum halopraeferens]|nr:hypothetical protein [Azospirillum halopraeferens]